MGAAARLGRWFVGVAVLLMVCGDAQRRRHHSVTATHRALPVCEWPALGMPWCTARSNAASAVRSRCGGACAGGCRRAGQVVCGGFQFCRFVEISRGGGSTEQSQRTEPCQCVSGQPWACHGALQGQIQPLQCTAGVAGSPLAVIEGLGGWFVGRAVFLFCEGFQRRRQHSATTAHRALPVYEWPAFGMPCDIKSSVAIRLLHQEQP